MAADRRNVSQFQAAVREPKSNWIRKAEKLSMCASQAGSAAAEEAADEKHREPETQAEAGSRRRVLHGQRGLQDKNKIEMD